MKPYKLNYDLVNKNANLGIERRLLCQNYIYLLVLCLFLFSSKYRLIDELNALLLNSASYFGFVKWKVLDKRRLNVFQYCIVFHLKCFVDSISSLWYDNYSSSHKFVGATQLLQTKLLLQIHNFVFLTALKCSRLIRQTLKFLPNITR